MIVDNGKYYVYRHVRKDTGEPFYIGIGRKWPDKRNIKKRYFRAYQAGYRSKFWRSVVSRSGFDVEILLESDSRDFIYKKEREFVSIHGIRDVGTGILVNMTDGGAGPKNSSKETKEKVTLTRKKTGQFSRTLLILKKLREEGKIRYHSSDCYVYSSISGKFIKKFESQKECSKSTEVSEGVLSKCFKNNKSYKGFIFSSVWLGDSVDISLFPQSKRVFFSVFKIDPGTRSVVSSYSSLKEAAKDNGVTNSCIFGAIKNNVKANGFFWAKENFSNGAPIIKPEKVCYKFIPVFCYSDTDDIPIMNFISSEKAGRHFGCTGANIRRAVRTKAKAAGYYWAESKNIDS